MLIRLCDLRWRQIRDRRPVLVGKVGHHRLTLVQRNQIGINGEAAALSIGSEAATDPSAKPLPPIWDAERAKWIGPAGRGSPQLL
jgi:hypothetical protein